MGKRKIAIEKIEDRQRRNVTFSKRREGLFKKAETACQKFGLKIGIVVFSPAGKPFTFCNSSSVSVDSIIDGYMSTTSSSSAAATVVVGKRSRSADGDDDDVQLIETHKKKKQRKTTMNAAVTPCITTVQEEEEKLDQGFHYKNVDSEQTHDQELTYDQLMGSGENNAEIVTEEEILESSQFLVNLSPDVQQIINLENFEYADHHHHHHHHHHDETTMGLLPPPHTCTSLSNSTSLSDMNEEEEVGGSDENYGYTLEEWEHIFSTSPTSVVSYSTPSPYMHQEVISADWPTEYMHQEVVSADWPTAEFLHGLRS